MKPSHYLAKATMILVAVLAVSATATYGFRMLRATGTPPRPTLARAYQAALSALGSETNTFYCLAASAKTISDTKGPTEWHLEFYSTNGQLREVVVSTSEEVIVRNKLRETF